MLIEPQRPRFTPFHRLSVFLGLLFVSQVYLFGFGIFKKLKAPPEVTLVEKLVPHYIETPVTNTNPSNAVKKREHSLTTLPELPPLPKSYTSAQAPSSILNHDHFQFSPAVNDPLENKLLKEARAARVIGDMREVALKLQEVKKSFPDSPHADYMLAEMFEAMGVFDKAADHYENVFSFGISQAGALYKTSADKLKEGFTIKKRQPKVMAIGNVTQFKDSRVATGESVKLIIPILSHPEELIDPSQVSISVRIFDEIDNQIVPCLPSNRAECTWQDDQVNWKVNGLEHLSADYFLPNAPSREDYGAIAPRSYYGYFIELSYRGELLDQCAWPRTVARHAENQFEKSLFDLPFEHLEIDLNSDNLLLPPLEEKR